MNVYMVVEEDYEGVSVLAVFDSESAANQAIALTRDYADEPRWDMEDGSFEEFDRLHKTWEAAHPLGRSCRPSDLRVCEMPLRTAPLASGEPAGKEGE